MNDSPITNINVSIDGMRENNDRIRGIKGYFDLAIEGIQGLRNKQAAFSVTLNGISARELGEPTSPPCGPIAATSIGLINSSATS